MMRCLPVPFHHRLPLIGRHAVLRHLQSGFRAYQLIPTCKCICKLDSANFNALHVGLYEIVRSLDTLFELFLGGKLVLHGKHQGSKRVRFKAAHFKVRSKLALSSASLQNTSNQRDAWCNEQKWNCQPLAAAKREPETLRHMCPRQEPWSNDSQGSEAVPPHLNLNRCWF